MSDNIIKIDFSKKPINDIIEQSKNVNPEKISVEVLTWVINNVESFIDNQNKIFKLDLVVDDVKNMEETKKLLDLYRAIPDDEEKDNKELDKSEKCRRLLDEITVNAFEHIKGSKELLKKLFERMSFYYEKIIPSPENKRRAMAIDEDLKKLFKQKEEATKEEQVKIQEKIVEKIKEGESLVKFTELEGSANIINFDYEAFDVGVQIKEGQNPNRPIEDTEEKNILKEYTIPEGFALWVEISYKQKQRPTAMF